MEIGSLKKPERELLEQLTADLFELKPGGRWNRLCEVPQLPPWLAEIYAEYWELDTERHSGESMGRIPWHRREEKLDKLGITHDLQQAERLLIWGQVENEHLAYHSRQIDAIRNRKP